MRPVPSLNLRTVVASNAARMALAASGLLAGLLLWENEIIRSVGLSITAMAIVLGWISSRVDIAPLYRSWFAPFTMVLALGLALLSAASGVLLPLAVVPLGLVLEIRMEALLALLWSPFR